MSAIPLDLSGLFWALAIAAGVALVVTPVLWRRSAALDRAVRLPLVSLAGLGLAGLISLAPASSDPEAAFLTLLVSAIAQGIALLVLLFLG